MKDFNQIYQKIYDECYKEIEQKRKEKLKIRIIFCGIGAIITFIILFKLLSSMLPTFIFTFFFAIALIKFSTITTKYNKLYKKLIISRLVSYYDEHLKFNENLNIREIYYKMAEFDSYDKFSADDYISGKIDGIIDFELGDVHTVEENIDSEGHKHIYTIFKGLFSVGNLKKEIPNTIKIRSDKGFLGKFAYNKTLMSMDSQEFEKHFDVYAEDKVLAMRILTSDIMDYMINFKTNNKVNFEITIKSSYIFIRIHCKNMFEGSILKNALDFETLHTYYKYLDFMCQLNKKLYNILEEKDF